MNERKVWLTQDACVQTSLDDRLGYHIVRRVTPPESPFAGLLARDDAGATALLVGVGGSNGWPSETGWSDGEHVVRPLDVITAPTGNEVVLPWCTEPVDAFLERRRLSGHELTAGEVVTLGVCILRGARDAIAAQGPGAGEWWLTGDGRPMFVPRLGGRAAGAPQSAHDPQSAVDPHGTALDAIARSARDRGLDQLVQQGAARVVAAASSCDRAVAPGRWAATVRAALDAAEDELFATSSPAPLEMRSLRPRVARSLSGGEFDRALMGAADDRGAGGATPWRAEGVRRRVWGFASAQLKDAAARHVDPEIADAAAQTWRRTQGSLARVLRRPLVVGLLLAALVVCVGVLWPVDGGSAGEEVSAVASSPSPEPEFQPEPEPEPELQPETAMSAPAGDPPAAPALDGIPAVAGALLVERTACGDAADCADRVYEDADAAVRVALPAADASTVRPIDAAAKGRRMALVDDLGGVAVLRVEVAGSAAEMLIIVQTERGWRIRDVFDVLDAPPTGGS